jgi:phosphatidylglycerol lysyltransferase
MKHKLSKLLTAINRTEVVLLLMLAVLNLAAPFYTFYGETPHFLHYFALHHTIRRLISFVLLLVAWKLYKRMSSAWVIAMLALSVAIFQYLFLYRDRVLNPWFLLELASYFVLLLSRNYYCRKADRHSLKRGFLMYFVYVLFVFSNAAVSLLKDRGLVSFEECVRQTVDVMFGADSLSLMLFCGKPAYRGLIFWFSWGCIVAGLFFFLTPFIGEQARTHEEVRRVRELVKKYGENCSSYLALEKDKRYLFGRSVDGVIAYGTVRDTLVVLGEPICAPGDLPVFLTEIREYCRENAYSLLFLNVTGTHLDEYRKINMGAVKCGEEPRFYLPAYSISGGKAAKMRLNINHAKGQGLRVLEYRPSLHRDPVLERKITEISQEWFSMKKCSELVFTMGGIGFDRPMDRRYFYAVDPQGGVEGFIVFLPFKCMNGYVADVTRYRRDATRGIVETIFYEAVMTFRAEGIEWASLALAPLARLEEEPAAAAKILNLIYEKMNGVYGFKALYQAKLKYNPTHWEPCYYVYDPPRLTPAAAYAVVKIQNPRGIWDYAKTLFRSRRKKQRPKQEA